MAKTYSEYMMRTCDERAGDLGRIHVIKTDHGKLFGFNFKRKSFKHKYNMIRFAVGKDFCKQLMWWRGTGFR